MKSLVVFFALIAISQGTFLKFLWTSPEEEGNNEKEEESSSTEQTQEETYSFHPIPLPVPTTYVVKPPESVYEEDDTNPNVIPPPNFYQVPHIVNTFIPSKNNIYVGQNYQQQAYPVLVKNPAIPPHQFYAGNNILLRNPQQWTYPPNLIPVSGISNEETQLTADQIQQLKDNTLPSQGDVSHFEEKYPVLVNHPPYIPENQFYGSNNIFLSNGEQLPYHPRFMPASSISNEEAHLSAEQTDIPADIYQSIPIEANSNQYENFPPLVNRPTIPDNYFYRENNIILPNTQQLSYPPNFVPVHSQTNEETHLTSDEARYTSEDFAVPVEHNPNQYDNYKLSVNEPTLPDRQFYQGSIRSGNDQQWQYSPNFVPVSSHTNEETRLTSNEAHYTSEDFSVPIDNNPNQYDNYQLLVNKPNNQFHQGNILSGDGQQWPYPPNFVPVTSQTNEETHLTSDETHYTSEDFSVPVEHNPNQYDNYKLSVNKPTLPDRQFHQGSIRSGNDQQWQYSPNFVPVSSQTNEETRLTSNEAHYTSEDISVPIEHNPNQYDNYQLLVNKPAIPNNQFHQSNILSGDDQQWPYPPNFEPGTSQTNEETHLTSDETHYTSEDFSIPVEHNPNQYDNYKLLVNKPAIPDNQFYQVNQGEDQQWHYSPNFVPAGSRGNEQTHLTVDQAHQTEDISITSEHNSNKYESNQFYESNQPTQQWSYQPNTVPADGSSYEGMHQTSDGSSYEGTHQTSDGSSYKETHLTSDSSSYKEDTHQTSDHTDLPAEEMELSINENESSHENIIETTHESSSEIELSKDEAVINFNNIGSDNNNNEYYHSYTLDDGTTVVEEGNLVEKNGSVVLVKHGEYQRQESDGKISSVKWVADESGFRITE